jgi:NosR/NirI family transcriptional regulator, nitrous oxide reductase regulator
MEKIFTITVLFLSGIIQVVAESRFPKPEFTTGYESPIHQQPLPTAEWMPYLSLGLLLLVMVLTGYAVYKWRSRRIQTVLIVFSLAFFGFFREGCVCAIGSIQNVTAALADTTFSLSLPTLGFFVLPLLVALFFGRLFCGAACPMGALQELVLMRPLRVPKTLDRVLRLIPPLYLGAAVLFAFCGLGFIICSWDPFVGLFRLSGSLFMLCAGGFIVILSIFIARPYCRYICPYGVLLKAAAFFSSRQVSITPDECIKCRLCEQACPSDVIIPPRPRKYAEPGFVAVRRIQWLLAMTPAMIAVGIIAGYLLAKPAMALDSQITLLHNIEVANVKDEAVIAFLATGTPVKDLVIQVQLRKQRLKIGWMLFGAWSGLVIAGSLIATSRRRRNQDFITDRLNCICCSRCYAYCPRELKKKKPGTAGVPPAFLSSDVKSVNTPGTAGVPPASLSSDIKSGNTPGTAGVPPANKPERRPGNASVPPANLGTQAPRLQKTHRRDAYATITGTAGVPPASLSSDVKSVNTPGTAGVPPASLSSDVKSGNTPGTAGVPPAFLSSDVKSDAPPAKKWHSRGYLPHFNSDQAIQFITFRLHDSVPAKVVDDWKKALNWTEDIAADSTAAVELREKIAKYEDTGSGECYLKKSSIAKLVQNTLLHYDGEKYHLIEWSIMPNHVHLLIQLKAAYSLSKIIHSWKSFTAHAANKSLKRTGPFWQADYYDRYIRDEKHYWNTVEYIQLNPVKAGLVNSPDDWEWSGVGGEKKNKIKKDAGETPAVPGFGTLAVLGGVNGN